MSNTSAEDLAIDFRRHARALRGGTLAVLVLAAPVLAQPAASDDAASSKLRVVECPLPPTLAPLVDDSAAFVSVSASDAKLVRSAMRECAAANKRDGATWFRFGYLAHLYHSRAKADSTLMPRFERVRLRTEGDSGMKLGLASDVPLEAARVEAFDPMTGKGATASVQLANFETRGRDMSDVMLATRVGNAAAARWTALAPTLAVGPVTSDSIVVAWALYEFATDSRWAYDVTLELIRRDAGGVRGAVAATLGTLRDLVRGAEVETDVGRVQVAYARAQARPVDDAALEVITLGIGALDAGTYDVRVTVRDPASGWSATRGQVLEVVR